MGWFLELGPATGCWERAAGQTASISAPRRRYLSRKGLGFIERFEASNSSDGPATQNPWSVEKPKLLPALLSSADMPAPYTARPQCHPRAQLYGSLRCDKLLCRIKPLHASRSLAGPPHAAGAAPRRFNLGAAKAQRDTESKSPGRPGRGSHAKKTPRALL